MNLHNFVFENRFPYNSYRHISFWLSWWIFLTIQALMFLKNTEVASSMYATIFSLKGIIWFFQIIYTYTIVYFLVPKYLHKNKTALFFVAAAGLALVIHSLTTLIVFYKMHKFNQSAGMFFLEILNQVRNFLRTGPFIVCALFIACKMAKNYYLKLEEKNALIRENANAELQLLKAQVHPHFLFNTLNNIYSLILNKSPNAEALITKLSDTMHYMINDCGAGLVPLEKELKMITDYTGLEQVRYGNRLKMEIVIDGNPQNKLIAPLLLIPFVENSFKHGTSQMLQQPWINLQISIDDYQIFFHLTNSKPVLNGANNGKCGIGLKNAKKRLALLYTSQYELTINNDNDTFSVHMKIPLHKVAIATKEEEENKEEFISPFKTLSYA